MRWDGGGDDGVDDDPDDARRDGDDDGGDSPLPGGKFPSSFLPAGALLLSIWFPPRGGGGKLFIDTPDVFRSKGSNTTKGSRRGAIGTRSGSHPRPRVDPRQRAAPAPWSSPPCALLAP